MKCVYREREVRGGGELNTWREREGERDLCADGAAAWRVLSVSWINAAPFLSCGLNAVGLRPQSCAEWKVEAALFHMLFQGSGTGKTFFMQILCCMHENVWCLTCMLLKWLSWVHVRVRVRVCVCVWLLTLEWIPQLLWSAVSVKPLKNHAHL